MSITGKQIEQNASYEALKNAVIAVEENNSINSGAWADWDDATHICETYGLGLHADYMQILQRAISSNGTSLANDLRKLEGEIYGVNFGGAGFPHPGCSTSGDIYWIDRIEAKYAA